MATNYPSSVDDNTTLPDPTAFDNQDTDLGSGNTHTELHVNLNDAVKAIESDLLGTVSGAAAISSGSGVPTLDPVVTTRTALYFDEDTDDEYYWNVTNQEWRRRS